MRAVLCAAVVAAELVGVGDALADPRGIWETEGGKSHVRLADCENKPEQLCGTIVWMKTPRKDVKNDNERLRDPCADQQPGLSPLPIPDIPDIIGATK